MIRDGNYVGDKLTAGEPVIGLVTRLFSPTVVELAGLTGFDYVWIDMEHGAASFETAENLVRATTGIDIIFIGLADLSQNLGHPGAYDHPEVVAASHHIVDVARAAGKHIGVPAANAATMKPWMDRGVRLFFCAVDVPLLAQALKTALKNCEPSS